nr:Protein F38E11.6, isoform a [Haemonchus contortus]
MGCAPSGQQDNARSLDERFAAPPPLHVKIGTGVIRGDDLQHHIIFIFGGPGSQKGLVIEELIHRFGFQAITVEDIIFSYLPSKVANAVETTAEIQKMLKRDTGTLSVDWIFSMISAKIGTSSHQRFVIDIVPSINSISRADSFVDSNHERCLENFERRFPVMFAVELDVSDEVAMLDRNGNLPTKSEKEAMKNGNNQNNTYGKDIDATDRGKLEKRIQQHHLISRPFLRYFSNSKRVVRITVPEAATNVVSTVASILVDFGFTEQRKPGRVIVFGTDDEAFDDIDFDYYKMRKIRLSDIVKQHNASMNAQVHALYRYISKNGAPGENFAVVMDTMNNTEINVRLFLISLILHIHINFSL